MTSSAELKYTNLVRVIDSLMLDLRATLKRDLYKAQTAVRLDHARSRTFIHLYLKVIHGVENALERENCITDGTGDGGLDGYHIDLASRTVYLIQSKFRSNAETFAEKKLEASELSKLHIDDIVRGNHSDERGNTFNGRIKAFQEKLSKIPFIAEFNFKIVILANIDTSTQSILSRLYQDYYLEIYDFERSYSTLLYPSLSSEESAPERVSIHIDLAAKTKAPRLEAIVSTRFGPSNLSVFLVPALEIARITLRYRNSLLNYNPRSYLEFQRQGTNIAIRDSIMSASAGEFALFNNGIVMIAQRCIFSDKTGNPQRASISISKPQIINGGANSIYPR